MLILASEIILTTHFNIDSTIVIAKYAQKLLQGKIQNIIQVRLLFSTHKIKLFHRLT
jgi:hypothetical protein